MKNEGSQILDYNVTSSVANKLSKNSFEKIGCKLENNLVVCRILNIDAVSSKLNSAINDLNIVEKKATISFLRKIYKNLDE